MDRYRCIDCTLWFETSTESTRCDKCASRLGEGAVTPSPTSKMVSSGNSIWNGWSWYHGPGKAPHLLPVEVDLGIPSTVPEGGVYYFDWADTPITHPSDYRRAVSAPIGIVNDFRTLRRLHEDAIVRAFGIPAHLLSPVVVTEPNPGGVAGFKAHLLRWAADKSGLDAEIKRRGLSCE